jgi:hypothetical protein
MAVRAEIPPNDLWGQERWIGQWARACHIYTRVMANMECAICAAITIHRSPVKLGQLRLVLGSYGNGQGMDASAG